MLRPDDLGKVQPGYLADLILVDGNPLDDVTILQDHDKLHYIMKDGRLRTGDYPATGPARTPVHQHQRRRPAAPLTEGPIRKAAPPRGR